MTPEGKIKRKLTDMLKSYKVWYFMPANNGFGKSGIPDVIAVLDGLFIGIECKADKSKKPTALQLKRAQEIQEAGGLWFLVYDDETIKQIERLIQVRYVMKENQKKKE